MSYKPVDAAITMVVGPCIDDTDFKSLEEAIAYDAAGMDVSLIVEKTDGTTAVTAITLTTGGTSDWTHKDGGYYEIEITAAQNVEEGVGYIRGVCTGVLPFESAHYNIVKANVYDSWVKGTDVLHADITQLGGVAQSATDLKDFADAGYDPGTNKITGTADMRGTDSANTTVPDAAGVAPTTAEIKTAIEAAGSHLALILADTGELQTDWKNGGRLDVLLDACNTTTPPTVLAIADQVWDEILTGATHNIATSAGRRLREIAAFAIHGDTAQSGTTTSITLAAAASANDGVYNRNLIAITEGAGAGQTRQIADYNGTTKVASVDREWRISPDATSVYQVTADNVFALVDQGMAQAGTATTITLRAYAASVDNTYLCNQVAIIAGTGRGQARLVGAYNGTTKVATICGDDWVTTPDATSVYVLLPYGTTCTSCVGTHARTQIRTEMDTNSTKMAPSQTLNDYKATGFSTHNAAAVKTAIEAAGSSLALILADTGTSIPADIAALNDITVADIIAGISDGTLDLQEMMRIILAATAGKSSGGGTVTLVFRDAADSKARITATVDANGNRTAMTLDGA